MARTEAIEPMRLQLQSIGDSLEQLQRKHVDEVIKSACAW
jgi:hypothetical protein